jgi:putative transcriptional regulator
MLTEQDNFSPETGGEVIQSRLGEVLTERDKSLYWLQQQTQIAYTTLFRLRHNQASSVSFEVMNKICRALECQPGDLFVYLDEEPQGRAASSRTKVRASKRAPKIQAKAAGVAAGA